MKNKIFQMTTIIVCLFHVLACKSPRDQRAIDNSSNIKASVENIQTTPKHLEKPLRFDLICEGKVYKGELNDKELTFQGTNEVKTGESCVIEAWGSKLAEVYEYFGAIKEDEAQYLISTKAEVSDKRKLSFYTSVAYREISGNVEMVSLFLGKYPTKVEYTASIKCVGSEEYPGKVDSDGYLEIKIPKAIFADLEVVSCKGLILSKNNKIFENLTTGIEVPKKGMSKEDAQKINVAEKGVTANPNIKTNLSEGELDGTFSTGCVNSLGAEISTKNDFVIKTEASDTTMLIHTKTTYGFKDCEGDTDASSNEYVIEIHDKSEDETGEILKLTHGENGKILYSKFNFIENKFNIVKGENYHYFEWLTLEGAEKQKIVDGFTLARE